MMTTISGLYLLRITDNLNKFYLLPYKDKKADGLFRNWSIICHCEGNVVKQSDRNICSLRSLHPVSSFPLLYLTFHVMWKS
ncbi:hypothetical protein [Nostoc sp.]|uniref:hypothetical protein n=1 Tax=Nostoc sp. TaxID=1180 RepID=UPI002FF67069